mmetsp:Transcript_30259/g.96515  ORF Transcript_30259/g.96515 Transcript_30259/m.96515 type:complete len:223 (-) Transcript_30259:1440-2108(-)
MRCSTAWRMMCGDRYGTRMVPARSGGSSRACSVGVSSVMFPGCGLNPRIVFSAAPRITLGDAVSNPGVDLSATLSDARGGVAAAGGASSLSSSCSSSSSGLRLTLGFVKRSAACMTMEPCRSRVSVPVRFRVAPPPPAGEMSSFCVFGLMSPGAALGFGHGTGSPLGPQSKIWMCSCGMARWPQPGQGTCVTWSGSVAPSLVGADGSAGSIHVCMISSSSAM